MAARFCSKCGREIASTAQFCSGCGTPVGSGPQVTPVEAATNTTRRLLVPATVIALLVLVVAVVLLAHAHAPVTSAPSLTAPVAPAITNAPSAPAPAAPAVTNAPSQPAPVAPAITNAPSKAAPSLPPEDARYLAFLQQIEQRRVALNNDFGETGSMLQEAQGMQGLQGDSGEGDPDQHNSQVQSGVGQISKGYGDYVTKCSDLTRDFRAVNPPPDCSLIANAYLALLTDYAATISKLQVALMNHDIGSVMGEQSAQKQINTDATQADQGISNLCTRFDVPKPFSIQVDGASSPLTGI
jgi:hypothetical protein